GSKRVHQLRPLLVTDPERRTAALAVISISRPPRAVDRCIPYSEHAFSSHSKRGGYAHDVDRVSAAPSALAADRAIAALVRVRGVAVDADADRTAATGPVETHRHLTLPQQLLG